MAYVDVNTPVIDRITLPSGNTYYIADREIRDVVDALSQAIAGGVAYIIAWDGTSTPVVANIPAGVGVTYNGTSYVGTLAADNATPGAFYLVKSSTQSTPIVTWSNLANVTVNSGTFYEATGYQPNTTYEFHYGRGWQLGLEDVDLADYGITIFGTPNINSTITVVTPSSFNDIYDEYVPIGETGSKAWEKIGDTQIDLSNVVTNVTLNKQTDTVIGTDATFTITQPTVALSTGATAGTGVISVATGITSASASGDNVTALTGLGSPSTKNAIGANSTFTITQPTVALATDTTSGTGKVQVMTGVSVTTGEDHLINAVTGYASPTSDTFLTGVKVTTQPTVSLTANTSSGTGRITYVQSQGSAQTTKLSATASGGAVSASGDNVTALTGLGNPSTKSAIGASSTFTITQPTITLASNASTATGRVQVATGISSASASGDNVTALTGLGTPSTQNAVKSVTPTTKKLATTTITGVSGSTTPSVVQGRTSQTTATGGGTASTTNTDWLKGVSVSNGVLTIGAATLATQTTYSANAPGTITVPTAASNATTVATGSTTTTGSGANIVTDVTVGDTFAAVTGYASPTTDTVLGTSSTITVTPSTTYLGATASGANTAWNSKDTVAAVTGYASPTTDTVLGTGTTITVTPTTTNIKATASGANTAWNNKDTVTVLTNATDVDITKGA